MHSLLGLAWVGLFRGNFAAARAAIAESRAAAQPSLADSVSITTIDPIARWILGWLDLAGGNAAHARETLAAMVEVFRSSPMSRYAAVPLVLMAEAQLTLGALDDATASLDEAASRARSGAMTWVLGRAALVRAKLHARDSELDAAESQAHESLGLAREAGDQLGLVDALEALGRLAAGQDSNQDSNKEAVRLWAAAETLREELGYVRFPVEQGPYEGAVASANQALGPDDFAAAWAEGAKLSREEAIAYAARGRGERRRPTAGWASLSPSELVVVRLVGQHLSNPEIAAKLFVSRATVKTHLVHIFAKLSVGSRSALAAEAVRRGMVSQPDLRK